MSSLSSIMSIALSGLQADQSALAVTGNNITNANTPGYTREVVNLTESPTIAQGNVQLGTGVTMQGFTSVRDELLQSQINAKNQQVQYSQAQLTALQQIEVPFSSTTSGLGIDLTSFFNSLSQLTTSPSDLSLRQAVLTNASSVVADFHQAAVTLSQVQEGLDQSVPKSVDSINQLSMRIADLNQQIAAAQSSGDNSGGLEDRRDQLVSQLSQLTGIQTSVSSNGETITTGNGIPLVVGDQSFQLTASTGTNGMQQVFQGNVDVTSSLIDGSLGASLQVRDSVIPVLQNKLDTLASQFSSAMNAASQSGFDLTGAAGTAMFSLNANTSAAAGIQLVLNSASQIAASADGNAGSGGNLTNLLEVRDTELPSRMTPLGAYADLVYTVGSDTALAQSNNQAASAALTQLQSQQASVSGVSLDEETTNMLQYQQAYQAAAKVISTINSLYQSLINIGTT